MYTLLQSINWAKPFVQYQPLNAGTAQEPAISTASMIRNTILGAPMTWPWNRNESLNNSVVAGTQDYTINLTDFGFLEKATLTDDQGNISELTFVFNNAPLSQASSNGGRPDSITVHELVPYTSVTFRVMGMPQQNYKLDLVYQKIAIPFLPTSTITQVVVPNGAFDIFSTGNGSVGSVNWSGTITPTHDGIALLGVAAEGNASLTNPSSPGGWTVLNTTTDIGQWSLATTGGTPVTVGTSYTVSNSGYAGIAGVLVNVSTNGSTPGVTTVVNNQTGNLNSGPVTLTGPYTISGATMAVAFIALGQAVGSAPIPATISALSDNQGNTWIKVAEPVLSSVVGGTNYWSTGMSCWVCVSPATSSAYTFTLTGAGLSAQNQNFNMYAFALTNTIATPTNPIYIGTFAPGVYEPGGTLVVTGFVNPGNNGSFPVLAVNSQTAPTEVTVTNASAVDEIAPATAGNLAWSPIPDNYMDLYNNLFIAEMFNLVDEPSRASMYRQRGVGAFLARSEGLTDSQKNAFLQQWGVDTAERQAGVLKTQQGVQARGV